MAQSTFTGPIRSGNIREGLITNTGNVLMMQYWTYDIPNLKLTAPNGIVTALTLAAGTFNSIMYIPTASIITNIYTDVDVVYDQGTSAAATVGTAAGGTQYVTTMDLKGASGRITPTFSAAQLLAMNNAAATTTLATPPTETASAVYLRITSVGTVASTGHGFIYVFYQQTA